MFKETCSVNATNSILSDSVFNFNIISLPTELPFVMQSVGCLSEGQYFKAGCLWYDLQFHAK